MPLEIIILAAGKGTRMRSSTPKVLHRIGGKPLLQHILETTRKLKPAKTHIVVGHGKDQVIDTIWNAMSDQQKAIRKEFNWVEQREPLGTGHAVMQALPKVKRNSTVLILNGDTPLISAKTLRRISNIKNSLKLLTVALDNPTGMGRILRNDKGKVIAIVEEKDANKSQKNIRETNTNCIAANAQQLQRWLVGLDCENAQKEYYLTDAIAAAVDDGIEVRSVSADTVGETLGVNSKIDLANLERIYQSGQAHLLMKNGVTVMDPSRIDVRGSCTFGNDCLIDINVIFEGSVKVGNEVVIGPNTVIRNARIGDGTVVEANSVIDDAVIGKNCNIGPFARIRPQTILDSNVRIGNFVETKKSDIGSGSKVNHLSYVGDSEVGKDVNIGAGVITCNYDGANKHKTRIGDDVFVGSDSQLVAPVKIGRGATIGAGSTITDDVTAESLAVSRNRQRAIKNWRRPKKQP